MSRWHTIPDPPQHFIQKVWNGQESLRPDLWDTIADPPKRSNLVTSGPPPRSWGYDVGVFAKKKPLLLASFSSKVTWLDRVFSGFECKELRWVYTPKVDSSPPEIAWAPKGKDRLPTICFIKKQFARCIWTKLCPLVGSFWILKTWIILKTSHLFRPTGLPGYTYLKRNFAYSGSVSTVRIQQFGFKDSACCSRCFLGVPWIIEAIWKVDRSCFFCISLHCLL